MAKKIKLPLILNGAACRTIGDLQANWDTEEIYNFFVDGKLLTWCQDRRYVQADRIAALSKDDADVRKKICAIFEVDYIPTETSDDNSDWEPKDSDEQEKFDNLKRITDDKQILKKFRQAAFDRDELIDLLDEDVNEIYLCHNTFEDFPIADENKTYIGVGNAVAIIPSKEIIDFDARNIKFVNVKFDDAYQKLFGQNPPEPKFFPSTPQKNSSDNQAEEFFKLAEQEEYVKKDYSAAFGLYKKAAELGHSEAMNNLGRMYYGGKGTEKNLNEAFRWCKKSYDSGNVGASYDLAWLYNCGHGTEKNLYKAFTLLQEAEKAGIFGATNALGLMYLRGDGTAINPQKAFECFRKAADAGNADAMNNLAENYYDGNGLPQDEQKAFEWHKKAAEAGNAEAMNIIGLMYDNGENVREDKNKAVEWYKKAAELGNTTAMCNLGYYYGEMRNLEQAEYWYKKAFDLGDVFALNELGRLYQDQSKYLEASKCYTVAAEKGDSDAMLNLAHLYRRGVNINGSVTIRKDIKRYEYWLEKSVRAGNPDAKQELDAYNNRGFFDRVFDR